MADRALASHPNFAAAHLIRAQANLMLARPNEGLASVQKLLPQAQPQQMHAQRGHLLRHLATRLPVADRALALKLAEADLTAATDNPEISVDSLEDLGAVLHAERQFSRAIDCYSRAIARDGNRAQSFIKRAWSHEAMRHLKEAESDFSSALALAPEDPEALAGLGYIEASLGRIVRAQRLASLALLRGGTDYLVLHNVACIHARLAALDAKNAADHEQAALDIVRRAIEVWRGTWSGPNELQLIQLEVAFTPEFRRKALMQ